MADTLLKNHRFFRHLGRTGAVSAFALAMSILPAAAEEPADPAATPQPRVELDLFSSIGLSGDDQTTNGQSGDKAAAVEPELTAPDDDPLESLNRFTFGFNQVVRGIVLDPLVSGYKAVTPEPMQKAVSNVASNLSEPVTVVSSILQGDSENAANSTQRFLVNSTVGLGGVSDPATDMGVEQRREDLGQAMAVNGVQEGTYLVLPILGPTTTRDATGELITGLASPMPLVGSVAAGAVEYSDNQEAIKAATANSLDAYETEKALYLQHRQYLVNNGATSPADGPVLVEDDAPSLAAKETPTAK